MAADVRPELLLVHGAWHGGWCFADLQAALRKRGVVSRTVDLPSSGGIADLADDAAVVRAALRAHSAPTVLVGHSYGGAVISEAAAGVPHVRSLAYLCAFMLDAGVSVLDVLEHRIPDWVSVDPESGTATVPDPNGTFYADCRREVAEAAAARLVPHCLGAFASEQTAAAWHDVPSTYVICDQDRAVPPAAQEMMASRAQSVVRLPTSHSPFLSAPDDLADILVRTALI